MWTFESVHDGHFPVCVSWGDEECAPLRDENVALTDSEWTIIEVR